MSAWGNVTFPSGRARRNELAQALLHNIGPAARVGNMMELGETAWPV